MGKKSCCHQCKTWQICISSDHKPTTCFRLFCGFEGLQIKKMFLAEIWDREVRVKPIEKPFDDSHKENTLTSLTSFSSSCPSSISTDIRRFSFGPISWMVLKPACKTTVNWFQAIVSFLYPLKISETRGPLIFSRSTKKVHWTEKG